LGTSFSKLFEQHLLLRIYKFFITSIPLPVQGLGASWEVEGQVWGGKFSKNLFRIYHNKKLKDSLHLTLNPSP
jgi:hypothetical protein